MVEVSRLVVVLGGLLMMVGILLALRWTFGTGRNPLEPRLPDPADPTGDGLLTEVSRVPTAVAAQVLCTRLHDAGIRATIGRVGSGYRLLVFQDDVVDARLVLRADS